MKKGKNRLNQAKYRKLAEEVMERDGCCVLCGRPGHHVHHIVFRSQGGKDEKENLAFLCTDCHQKAHGVVKSKIGQRGIRELLQAYIAGVV